MTATSARDVILARIRSALSDRQTEVPIPIPRNYRQAGTAVAGSAGAKPGGSPAELADLFAERVADYRATVRRCGPNDVAVTVATALAARGATRVVVADGFPSGWRGAESAVDGPAWLTVQELDEVDAVVTTCAVAIAETGTFVLDATAGQGRRALTLVPDFHLAIVRADQIVRGVPEALTRLNPTRALTWVSGPSATSDIELQRVEGVHGPRVLEVVIVDCAGDDSSTE